MTHLYTTLTPATFALMSQAFAEASLKLLESQRS